MKKSQSEVPAFGSEVARIRSLGGLSRPQLVKRLYSVLETNDSLDKTYSEAWLTRLENGEIVKIPRRVVIALCNALKCDQRQRAKLLLLADRNILLEVSPVVTETMEVFNYMVIELFEEMSEFLSELAGNRHISKLNEKELSELFYNALEIVVAERRFNH